MGSMIEANRKAGFWRAPGIWAIVPVKRLAAAKQRLASVLGDTREEFALLLACRTLDVLSDSGLFDGIIVVSPDPRVAAAALSRGAAVVDDADSSLNEACVMGIQAAAAGAARVGVLLPSDLASLSVQSVIDVVHQYLTLKDRHGARTLGLVRCKDATGTNMVILDPQRQFRPAFGRDSFAKHMRAAAGDAHELMAPAVAFDIDSPEDLERFAATVADSGSSDELCALVRARRAIMPLTASASGDLVRRAAELRDRGHGCLVTYSRKVFLPLTHLCRDSCHYCTFAKAPSRVRSPFMTVEDALSVAEQGVRLGCKEALFTLGERPELRYRAAREWLAKAGFASTLHYLAHAAATVRDRTGLLPHINAGCMSAEEMSMLRPVCGSMGLMLESRASRLGEKGGPHYGSPDKAPAVRLQTIAEAGRQKIPFTTGILIGIGETRDERIEALEALRELHRRYGHIQEIIVQNFVPKPGTRMADAKAPDAEELLWTIAAARLLLGAHMSIQAPPNLSPAPLSALIDAGITIGAAYRR